MCSSKGLGSTGISDVHHINGLSRALSEKITFETTIASLWTKTIDRSRRTAVKTE